MTRPCARLLIAVLVLFLAPGLASDAAPKKKKRGKPMPPVVAGKAGQRLDEAIGRLDQDTGGFWGNVLVAKGNKVLLCKSYGHMSPKSKDPIPVNALWDWASVSKQFTAAAILRLEMERKLSLDDSIRKFFPKIPEDKKPVTLRHMLNHTSGLNNAPDREGMVSSSRDGYVHAYLKQPVVSKPGEKWAYNNEAYSVLAAVVEKVQRKSFEEYCIQKLFKPAKMGDTSFIGHKKVDLDRVPKDGRGTNSRFAYYPNGQRLAWNYKGMGGVVSSTIDMFRWHRALQGDKLLSKQAKSRMYEVGLQKYACGWEVKKERGDTFYTHSGSVGEHVTYYLRAAENDVVVAVVYGYRPKESPEQTAFRLFKLALQK